MADTTSTHIIQYIGDLTSVQNKVKELTRLNQLAAQKLGNDFTKAVDIIDQKISKVSQRTIQVPIVNAQGVATGGFTNQIQTTSQLTSVIKTADGQLKTFTESQTRVDGAIKQSNLTLSNGAKVARNFGDDIKTLASRALLTIPIWIGIRTALTSMFQTITNGAKDLIAFDLGLQKVKRNLQGTPAEIGVNFKTLRDEITKTALETGVSTEQISEAVKKFATIGFNFKDSLEGGIAATKLSVVLFGDAGETANAFARALKILNDTSEDALPIQQQIQEAFALTAELEKTNQFDINEVTEALIKFSGTAKTAGLSTRETLSVLAALGTAGRAGASGATLLSTSINQLLLNLDKVASNFDVKFNPTVDNAFSVLTQVLDKAQEISKLPGGEQNVISKLADVFGGERGTKAISSLLALNDQLKSNIQVTPDVVSFQKQLQNVLETESGQAKILANNMKEFGKALVTSLIGTDDFTSALIKLNKTLTDLRVTSAGVARGLGNIFNINPFSEGGFGFFGGLISGSLNQAFKEIETQSRQNFGKVIDGINNQLSNVDLNQLILDIKENKIQIRPGLREHVLENLEKNLKNLESPKVKVEPTVEIGGITILESDRLELATAVSDARQKQLQSEGALTSEILKQVELTKAQLGIYDSDIDKAKRRLEIEQAVNDEKRLQNRLGSDSIKLFDIAQNNGVEAAKAIGDVLAGNTSFDTFIRRGGEAVDIFKEQFADIFKQQQAQQFFRGERISGNETLRGGSNIDIQENLDFVAKRFDVNVASDLNKAIRTVGTQTVTNMSVDNLSLPNVPIDLTNARNLLTNTAFEAIPNRTLPSNTPGLGSTIDQLKLLQAQGILSKSAQISITVDFNGTENVLIGTPDSIVGKLSDLAAEKAREATVQALSNPQSPISKAVNTRQEEF